MALSSHMFCFVLHNLQFIFIVWWSVQGRFLPNVPMLQFHTHQSTYSSVRRHTKLFHQIFPNYVLWKASVLNTPNISKKGFKKFIFELLFRLHFNSFLSPVIVNYQFAYKKKSVDDAISIMVHEMLVHLEKPKSNVHVHFLDLHSTFNIP